MFTANALKALDMLNTETEFLELHKHDVDKKVFEDIAGKVCRQMENLFNKIGKPGSDEEIVQIINTVHKLNQMLCQKNSI